MERKIKILIDYLYVFGKDLTQTETQKTLKRLRACGVKSMTFNDKEYELTNDFIKSIRRVYN